MRLKLFSDCRVLRATQIPRTAGKPRHSKMKRQRRAGILPSPSPLSFFTPWTSERAGGPRSSLVCVEVVSCLARIDRRDFFFFFSPSHGCAAFFFPAGFCTFPREIFLDSSNVPFNWGANNFSPPRFARGCTRIRCLFLNIYPTFSCTCFTINFTLYDVLFFLFLAITFKLTDNNFEP